MTPRQPSSQPPFGTESRWLPTMTVFGDAPGSVTQLLPAESVSIVQAELGDLAVEPLARVAPHRPPGEALRAVGRRGARGELAQVGDDPLCIHRPLQIRRTQRPRRSHLGRPGSAHAELVDMAALRSIVRKACAERNRVSILLRHEHQNRSPRLWPSCCSPWPPSSARRPGRSPFGRPPRSTAAAARYPTPRSSSRAGRSSAWRAARAGAATYDLRGLTLLPGLIDTHVHIDTHFGKDGRATSQGETPQQSMLYSVENAWVTLMAGFTTVQSIGSPSDVDLRAAIARGVVPGPRLLTSIRPVNENTGTPDEIRAFVRKMKADGADLDQDVRVEEQPRRRHPDDDRRADSGRRAAKRRPPACARGSTRTARRRSVPRRSPGARP